MENGNDNIIKKNQNPENNEGSKEVNKSEEIAETSLEKKL